MKRKVIILILVIASFICNLATIDAKDSYIPDNPPIGPIGWDDPVIPYFDIRNNMEDSSGVLIASNNFSTDRKYDLFELKDGEIYLNNSDIAFNIIDKLPDNKEYVVHITGTNKISLLNNIFGPNDSYMPFKVVGDGTLEIVSAEIAMTNSKGEKYYKCWYSPTFDAVHDKMNNSNEGPCFTEISINANSNEVLFSTRKNGYTKSDLKEIFSNNKDAFYYWMKDGTLSNEEFAQKINEGTILTLAMAPTILLNSEEEEIDLSDLDINKIEDRTAMIDRLVDSSTLMSSDGVIEETQITDSWGKQYIKTDLPRSFSKTGSYLINFPEEKDMITSTRTGNIVFESNKEFDPNYHLVVDDITENISDIQSLSVQAKTDKTLVELYDIYMADENNNVVKMEDGTYTIKVELSDLLKKYEGYEIVYISEDNKVELIDARVEDNYIVFNTTHLSKYGVVGRELRKTGNIIKNPQTADSVVTYGLALGALAVAVALVVLRIRKLKETN